MDLFGHDSLHSPFRRPKSKPHKIKRPNNLVHCAYFRRAGLLILQGELQLEDVPGDAASGPAEKQSRNHPPSGAQWAFFRQDSLLEKAPRQPSWRNVLLRILAQVG